MELRQYTKNDAAAIECLFRSVFTKSEGEAEGELVGNLAKELMIETAEDDLYHGLNTLRDKQVNVVLTYGDPRYYCKVGFQSISHEVIEAPFKLSQPEGWLGQSLVGASMDTISGRCVCVNAWNNPVYW